MSAKDDILEKVITIIRESMHVEEAITAESHLIDDLHAESLDVVCIAMELEEVFDIEIERESAEKLETVKNLADFVREAVDSNVSSVSSLEPAIGVEA